MTESNSDASTTGGSDGTPSLATPGLRGDALDGAEQKTSPNHPDYEETRNPDAELRLDGEDDTLYSDGLDLRDDSDSYAGTDGDAPPGIKG